MKNEQRSEAEEDLPYQTYQQKFSDEYEINCSSKPEFYDPNIDEKDELWAHKQRKGQASDATLTCPACFTTLCLDCQRHEKHVTRYRAVFVVNCKIKEAVVQPGSKRTRNKENARGIKVGPAAETFNNVCCSVCSTDVGVIDENEVYHFFNVLPSEA